MGRAGASLFESLELLHAATRGRLDVYREPVGRAIGQYIARAYMAGDYYVNIGDAPAKAHPEPELVSRYGRAVGDPSLAAFGSFLAARRGPYGPGDVPRYGSLARVLPALLRAGDLAATAPVEPLAGEDWLPDLQMMAASSFRLKQGGPTYSLTWSAPYSPKIFVESLVSYQDYELEYGPTVAGAENACRFPNEFAGLNDANCVDFDSGLQSGSFPVSWTTRARGSR